jgi:hypothetical protein
MMTRGHDRALIQRKWGGKAARRAARWRPPAGGEVGAGEAFAVVEHLGFDPLRPAGADASSG